MTLQAAALPESRENRSVYGHGVFDVVLSGLHQSRRERGGDAGLGQESNGLQAGGLSAREIVSIAHKHDLHGGLNNAMVTGRERGVDLRARPTIQGGE